MKAGKYRVAAAGEFPPDQGNPMLQRSEAARVKTSRQLVDRPDAGKHLHGRLNCTAGDRADFSQVVDGAQSRGSYFAGRH